MSSALEIQYRCHVLLGLLQQARNVTLYGHFQIHMLTLLVTSEIFFSFKAVVEFQPESLW